MEEQRAFGNFLRAERELRQIPLSEVASATKIPLQSLLWLEEGNWDNLPAKIFVRGFVRSYARHVGISVDDACARFNEILAQIDSSRPVEPVEQVSEQATDVGGRRKFGLALMVIIVLILATITLSLFWRRGAGASTHTELQQDSPSATISRHG